MYIPHYDVIGTAKVHKLYPYDSSNCEFSHYTLPFTHTYEINTSNCQKDDYEVPCVSSMYRISILSHTLYTAFYSITNCHHCYYYFT